jgi:cellulose synthase/poly-beta-1,6-N-acetylglucosamine synthase-like glycosyltransferase
MFKLKLRSYENPRLVLGKETHHTRIHWDGQIFHPHTQLPVSESAIETLLSKQVVVLVGLISFLVISTVINWHTTLVAVVSLLTLLYFSDLLFNLYLVIASLRKSPELVVSEEEILVRGEWPSYTIICPLYKEGNILPHFIEAISKLDYPKNKLQVLLVLEEDDELTVDLAKKLPQPAYFETLVLPHSLPKTKPKACNYALQHSTGEYIVIYDAEDRPESTQLKKAVIAFSKQDPKVICLQAKLNFYNPHQNLLTKLFTLEYSLWFDLVLTGLHSIGAPIPLGGTSNHFKRDSLKLLHGWDPFNVTEDCDLGIRLFKKGYRTLMLDSLTLEEANSSFFGWFPQRSRWIKGYIQTYFVHMRHPRKLFAEFKNIHILTFQLIIGGKILSMWINPVLWVATIAYFALRGQIGGFIESLYLTQIFYLAVFSLVFGNFLYLYYYMIGAAKREQWELVKYAFIVPVYWLMMSWASWIALIQIYTNPHYWEKTTHGLHLSA